MVFDLIEIGNIEEILPMYGLEKSRKREKSRRHTAKETTDADYASESAVFSHHLSYATTLLKSLEKVAFETGLNINVSKTEFMS